MALIEQRITKAEEAVKAAKENKNKKQKNVQKMLKQRGPQTRAEKFW
ncbi:hypothetical protein OVY01_22800 [Robbsia sp. Bb-Pol-6]|uniref:Uncharacterized protein n=1 Tax=Robbsia betulipollinis TaxID=2981849 RepID=A0ABT3ZTT5_9BURK|nr:hypothetical protein [Robbsia betulipollinis]MCY0389971.1 hypothetical protein [Robbsia betulipollinis]